MAIVYVLLFSVTASASSQSVLKQIQDSKQLATIIHRMVTEDINPKEFLDGIRSVEKLNIASYDTHIPAREIYGTIVAERFQIELGRDFYAPGKKYEIRAICAFIDTNNELWRYHVIVFEQRQYNLMEQVLRKQLDRMKKDK